MNAMDYLDALVERYPELTVCKDDIYAAYAHLADCFAKGGSLYICGNGGSAADALHIASNLVKAFVQPRPIEEAFAKKLDEELAGKLQGALPAYALVENIALTTAFANDVDNEYVFAQQVYAYAKEGDCVLGISTSGNSKNILHAFQVGKAKGASALGLAGRDGGAMKGVCDVCVIAPETDGFRIQEMHTPIYHTLALMLEAHFWVKED